MSTIAELARAQKLGVTRDLLKRLIERKAKGPLEEALDAFIPQFQKVEADLDKGVEGKAVANAARKAQLARIEAADGDVDAWYRHVFNYIDVEALRRVGPNVLAAAALRDAAFPEKLGNIDDYIPDENRICRNAIAVLQSPTYTKTVEDIALPAAWIKSWEAGLDESDAAFGDVRKAREATSANIDAGLDAETEFVDVAVRFRGYVSSRAPRSDKAKVAEGVELLAPLTEALAKARAEAAARATRRKAAKAPETPSQGATPEPAKEPE